MVQAPGLTYDVGVKIDFKSLGVTGWQLHGGQALAGKVFL